MYLRALAEFNSHTRFGYERARKFLEAALLRDGNFAEAWASSATCLARLAVDGWSGDIDNALKESCDAANRAAIIDPSNGLVLAQASWILAVFGGRIEQAIEHAYRAEELVPNSSLALGYTGWALIWNGEFERAVISLLKSRRLDPIDPSRNLSLSAIAVAYFFEQRFAESILLNERVTAELPLYKTAWRFLAAAHARNGELERAREIIAGLLQDQPSMRISVVRKFCHFRHAWMGELYLGGLQLAGLAE